MVVYLSYTLMINYLWFLLRVTHCTADAVVLGSLTFAEGCQTDCQSWSKSVSSREACHRGAFRREAYRLGAFHLGAFRREACRLGAFHLEAYRQGDQG